MVVGEAVEYLTLGPAFAEFCRRHVRHTKGRWAGHPLILEPWQQAFVDELLLVDPRTGLRVYQEAIFGLPRKNGKSTLCAALALFLLLFDGEDGPEVYVAAAALEQARIIFRQARQFVDASPTLRDYITPRRSHFEAPDVDGLMRVLSSDAALQHGLNPSANVIDELWAHETPDLYEALTTGGGAREQPLTVTITTAGFDPDTILGTIYAAAMDDPRLERPTPFLTILRDRDAGFLFYWYGLAQDANIEDRDLWRDVNPASWLQDGRYLERQRSKPTLRLSEFRRLHLGQWTSTEEPWVDPALWDACLDPGLAKGGDLAYPLSSARPLGVGVDVGETMDSTGVGYAQAIRSPDRYEHGRRVVGEVQRMIVRSDGWQNPYRPNDSRAAGWRMPHEDIRAYLRELFALYPEPQTTKDDHPIAAPGPAFGYDPWHFSESAEILAQEGLRMLEFPQFASRMIPATELLYALIRDGRLVHDGDPVLRQHVLNAVAQKTPRGIRVVKGAKSKRRIDRLVAVMIATTMASLEPPLRPTRKPRTMTGC